MRGILKIWDLHSCDLRPRINRAVPVLEAILSLRTNLVIVTIYGYVCLLFYGLGITAVAPLIQIFRTVFPFEPVHIQAWMGNPFGITNYPLAVLRSILSGLKLDADCKTLFFWVLPLVSYPFRRFANLLSTLNRTLDLLGHVYQR
jgi:hypothetical protein